MSPYQNKSNIQIKYLYCYPNHVNVWQNSTSNTTIPMKLNHLFDAKVISKYGQRNEWEARVGYGVAKPQWVSMVSTTSTEIVILVFNTLRPRQNGRDFADDIFKCIFLSEVVWISIKISLKFVPKGPIDNIPALVQIMAWRRPGDKSLSELMVVSLLTHICVTRPQWVKG